MATPTPMPSRRTARRLSSGVAARGHPATLAPGAGPAQRRRVMRTGRSRGWPKSWVSSHARSSPSPEPDADAAEREVEESGQPDAAGEADAAGPARPPRTCGAGAVGPSTFSVLRAGRRDRTPPWCSGSAGNQEVRTSWVCSRTCLTVVVPVPSRSSSRWAPSAAQPASVRKRRSASSSARRPEHGAAEPVGDHRVDRRLQQPRAVALAALARVDGELHQLGVGDGVAVGVEGRRGDREPGHPVALEGDQHPHPTVGRARQRRTPRVGGDLGVDVEHLGGQQVAEVGAPGGQLQPGDRGRVVGPGDPARDVGGGVLTGSGRAASGRCAPATWGAA